MVPRHRKKYKARLKLTATDKIIVIFVVIASTLVYNQQVYGG